MGEIKLEDCKQITSLEYMKLENPVFKGQTRTDAEKKYWMIFVKQILPFYYYK